MGHEYRLSFIHSDHAAVASSLLNASDAKPTSNGEYEIEFRRSPLEVGMPDATAVVEEYGLYFCDHGGHGREYLGLVVTTLVRNFGAVTVEELE